MHHDEELRGALRSCIEASDPPDEIIVVNDSGDDTRREGFEALGELHESIVILHNEMNLGVADALNAGLSISNSEYVCRMDADDVCCPSRFTEVRRSIVAYPDVDVFSFSVIIWSDIGERYWRTPIEHEEFAAILPVHNCIMHPAVTYRRAAVLATGAYPVISKYGAEDWALWLAMLESGARFTGVDSLAVYYRHGSSAYRFGKVIGRLRASVRVIRCRDLGFGAWAWLAREVAANIYHASRYALSRLRERAMAALVRE